MEQLKRTPLYMEYDKWRAKTINFGGWELPVQFSSIMEEHERTRTKASLFDVSHMGQIIVEGADSLPFLQTLLTNDVSKLTPHRVQYTLMCHEQGGTIDDFLLYMLAENCYLLVVNASNTEKNTAWLKQHQKPYSEVDIVDKSNDYAVLALQGPKAEAVLTKLVDISLEGLKPFTFNPAVKIKGLEATALISRTGYTGEDGFEIYINSSESRLLWDTLLDAGKKFDIKPAGLGARDTLRLEAGLPLYGQELSETITPVEANLPFAIKVDKGCSFVGKDILKKQLTQGPMRKISGIEMIEKGIPRTGYRVLNEHGEEIGEVTSGTKSPTLQKSIGFALLDHSFVGIGTKIWIQIRKRKVEAKVVKTPFYRRSE